MFLNRVSKVSMNTFTRCNQHGSFAARTAGGLLGGRRLVPCRVRWTKRLSTASSGGKEELEEDDNDNNSVKQQQQQQQQQQLDAFQVLNLARRFDIPQDTLKQSYRNLMANLHPDKHHNKSLEEQQTIKEQASQVTQSYQILKDAPTRATHMLQLMGKINDMEDNQQEASMKELLTASQGNRLLMEVMEIREAIEEATTDEELKPLLEENTIRIDEVCNKLATAFSSSSPSSAAAAAAADLDYALELTVMLQYYNRIDETIRNKIN